MQIPPNRRLIRSDEHDAFAFSLERAELFGDPFFVGKVSATEIDLQFCLDESGQQKKRQQRCASNTNGLTALQKSVQNDREKKTKSWSDWLDVTKVPEVKEYLQRDQRQTYD